MGVQMSNKSPNQRKRQQEETRGGKDRFEEISRRLDSLDLGGMRKKRLGRFASF